MWPLPSVTACSGIPPRSSVPAIAPSAALITVACGVAWLKTQTRSLKESYRMPSGLPCTSMVSIKASVLVSLRVAHFASAILAVTLHQRVTVAVRGARITRRKLLANLVAALLAGGPARWEEALVAVGAALVDLRLHHQQGVERRLDHVVD